MKKCKKCGGNYSVRCLLCELFATGSAPGGTPTTGWPMVSKALACHPSQVEAGNARNRKHGVNVLYDQKGNAHIPDRGERRRLLALEGMHDNNSFTSY